MSEIFILNMLFLQHGVKYEGQEQVSIKLFFFVQQMLFTNVRNKRLYGSKSAFPCYICNQKKPRPLS